MADRPLISSSQLFTNRKAIRWLTVLCLAGIGIGVLAGLVVSRWQPPGTGLALGTADAVVRAWTNAFRMLVAPLVMAQLYVAIWDSRGSAKTAGRLGVGIPVVFAGLLMMTAVIAFLATQLLMNVPWLAGMSVEALTPVAAAAESSAASAAWVDGFIPPNVFAAATTDNILPLMLFTLAFAVAMRHAEADAGEAVHLVVRGVAQASFAIVGWLLVLSPVVLLSLGFRSAVQSGAVVAEVILGFAALEIVIVLITLVALYLLVPPIGGVSLVRFARALWPAQLTAIATRSSLATLPALLVASTTTLRLRDETAAAVLPVSGATLKLSRALSGPVKLLFLAHVIGVEITFERLVVFAVTIILLSSTTVGVPTVKSGGRSLPAYVAAGVPAEYVVLLSVAVSLTDIFLTMLNSAGYLSAAVLVDRLRGGPAPVPARPVLASDAGASNPASAPPAANVA